MHRVHAEVPPADDDGPTLDQLVDPGAGPPEAGPGVGAPEPRRLAGADPVPVFRTDLQIERGANASLFELTDPGGSRRFTLYEFELSVARMLDGRRHASDVVENGLRLGIPIDLDGLNKFVRQLWRYGFLAPEGTTPADAAAARGCWPERVRWDAATRTLFQAGVRLARQGRPRDAEGYLRAVLDADPRNVEATELLTAIAEGRSLAAAPIGQRHADARGAAGGARRITVVLVGAVVLLASAAAGLLVVALRAPAPAPVAAPAAPPAAPPAAWRTAAVQWRERPRLEALAAPEPGAVRWKRATGGRVKAGDRIGTLKVRATGRAPLEPADAARIRELETLAKRDPAARALLDRERRALRAKRAPRRAREVPILVSEDGILSLAARGGATVAAGAPLASVSDERAWIVQAFLDGPPPPSDAACELRGDAVTDRVACRLDSALAAPGGSQLALTVRQEDAPWLEASSSLRVRIAPPGTVAEPALP